MAREKIPEQQSTDFENKTDSHFPLLILCQGKRLLCSTEWDLPEGVPFRVLETKCLIEIRHQPAMWKG